MRQAQRELAHIIDVHWIIALWIAIHGGDPAELGGEATVAMARALAKQLEETHPHLTEDPGVMLERLAQLGFTVSVRPEGGTKMQVRNAEHLRKFIDTSAGGYGEQGKVRAFPLELCLISDGFGTFCFTYWYKASGPEKGDG
jgi:hypothetical protein